MTTTRSVGGQGASRREFLRSLLVGGGAAAVALAGGRVEAAETAAGPPEKPQAGPARYHETDHIRDYYRTAAL